MDFHYNTDFILDRTAFVIILIDLAVVISNKFVF